MKKVGCRIVWLSPEAASAASATACCRATGAGWSSDTSAPESFTTWATPAPTADDFTAGANQTLHRSVYERGLVAGAAFPGHVLSVGGLLIGGSGKTPVAAWLAAALHDRGHRVALASRGYGRRGGERVTVVSDGQYVRSRAELAGDEPMVLVAHAPGVPVLVGRNRALVGLRAFSVFGSELLVLDDVGQ